MKNMIKQSAIKILTAFVMVSVSLSITTRTGADDIDIYLNTNASATDKPLIMFSLDFRPNLGNSVCSDSEDVAADGSCGSLVEDNYLDGDAITDNGNYSSLEIYRAVLKKVMDHQLDSGSTIADAAHFGIMMNHDNINNCDGPSETDCSNGGFILSKFRDLSDGPTGGNPSNLACDTPVSEYDKFFCALDSIPVPQGSNSDKHLCAGGAGEHKYQGAELFFEFFRYLTGQGIHNGHTGYTDFNTSSSDNMDIDYLNILRPGVIYQPEVKVKGKIVTPESYTENGAVILNPDIEDVCMPSPKWDDEAETGVGSLYDSPLDSLGACGGDIYTFNFMFLVSSQDDGSDDAIEETRAAGGMEGIALSSNSRFENVLEWLNDIDLGQEDDEGDPYFGTVPDISGVQNVTSYFFVPPTKVNTTTNGYASAGGSGASGAIGMDLTDVDATIDIIVSTLESVLSVSTTFVSPTLPSNVFNRTDLLDQVYIAIFKADEDLKPRWNGNLKRLHINPNKGTDINGNEISLGDPFLAGSDGTATGVSSTSAVGADGRIDQNTLSVWTHAEDVPANTATNDDYRLGKDGRSTVHGGSGGNIPGYRDPSSTGENPGLTNPGTTTGEFTNRKIFTEPAVRGTSTLLAFNVDDSTAIDLLEIGSGGASEGLADDAYYQTKVDLWREVMPWTDCEDYVLGTNETPSNCENYNKANADNTTTDEDTGIARVKDLIAYLRGFEDLDTATKRDWFMGDPLHSRPIAINYGGLTESTQNIRVAIATNDGALHFVRVDNGTTPDGVEEWAFTPRSVTRKLKRLHENSLSTTPVHPYLTDGSPTSLLLDTNNDGIISSAVGSTDKAYLYMGMRRGGKDYYALDVTDFQNPEMLWTIGKQDANFSELGQTWSQPQNIFIRYNDSTDTLVEKHALIFGGGFNGDDEGDMLLDDNDIELGKDTRASTDGDSTNDDAFTGVNDHEGNAVYIVDAITGDLIWKATGPRMTTTYNAVTEVYTTAVESGITTGDVETIGGEDIHYRHTGMVDSIPSIVTAVNATDFTNIYDDRAYVGDTGGTVWRFDFSSVERDEWKVTKLASLGRHDSSGDQTHDRRFFHAVDFALADDSKGAFDAVVIASGNRPNPLTNDSDNYLYMIRDRDTDSIPSVDSSLDHDGLQDLSDNCLQDGTTDDCTITFDSTKFEAGWKIKLEVCSDESETGSCGEKGLSKPLVLLGNIIFNSYVPPIGSGGSASCAPAEGNGQFYTVSLQDATAVENFNTTNDLGGDIVLDRSERLRSGGIPSDPVVAGSFSPDGSGTSTGILRPDLEIKLYDSFGLLKKYWYTTEPE